MAIQRKKGISGKVGNTVFRVVGDQQILQSAPGVGGVKQTEETKKAATLFGHASTLGGVIRTLMDPVIFGYYDTGMVSRLTGSINFCMKKCYNKKNNSWAFVQESLSALEGLDFNATSPLRKNLFVAPDAVLSDNILTVGIPELIVAEDMAKPAASGNIVIDIAVAFIEPKSLKSFYKPEMRTIVIEESQQVSAAQEFTFDVPAGCLAVTAIGIKYYGRNRKSAALINSKAFNPAAIISAVINPGEFNPVNRKKWH